MARPKSLENMSFAELTALKADVEQAMAEKQVAEKDKALAKSVDSGFKGIMSFIDKIGEREKEGEINRYPGRGFYFLDPDGNNMEVLTKPYGA